MQPKTSSIASLISVCHEGVRRFSPSSLPELLYTVVYQSLDLSLTGVDFILQFIFFTWASVYQLVLYLLYLGLMIFCKLTGQTRQLEKTDEMVKRLQAELQIKETSLYEQAGLYSLEQESGYLTESTGDRSNSDIETSDLDEQDADFDISETDPSRTDPILDSSKCDLQNSRIIAAETDNQFLITSQVETKELEPSQGLVFSDVGLEDECDENQNYSDSGFDDSTDADCSLYSLER